MIEAYRIVENCNGIYKTLFHGMPDNGKRSRTLRLNRWYTAEQRLVRDGGGQKQYMSGFNVLLNKQDLVDYMKRFTAERDLLIAKVEVEDLRPKPTNPLVMLAGRMKIVEVYRNN